MAQSPIPDSWRAVVCAILRDAQVGTIGWTDDYTNRFNRDFPDGYQRDVYDAFLTFLDGASPHGCPVAMGWPPGETWEFFFTFGGKKAYGKILLRTDQQRVVLFSAHLPDKALLRCERLS